MRKLVIILSLFVLYGCAEGVGDSMISATKGTGIVLEERAKGIIRDREGLRLETYRCSAGVRTIGYGHTGWYANAGIINEEFAEELLDMDFECCLQESEAMIGRRNYGFALFLYGVGSTKSRGSRLHEDILAGRDPKGSWLSWCIIPGRSVSDVKKMRLAEYNLYKISDGRR